MAVVFHNMLYDCLEGHADDILVTLKEVYNHVNDLKKFFVSYDKYTRRMNLLKCALVYFIENS